MDGEVKTEVPDRYDHPNHWLTNSDRGAEICRRLGSQRLRMLFDCYHMRIMEGDMVKHIERNIDVIAHFHSAAVSGRHEVFRGETDYPSVLDAIAVHQIDAKNRIS